jgi:hypothetical protein
VTATLTPPLIRATIVTMAGFFQMLQVIRDLFSEWTWGGYAPEGNDSFFSEQIPRRKASLWSEGWSAILEGRIAGQR